MANRGVRLLWIPCALVLLGTVQQVVQVTVSSEWNLLIVGVLLVAFVTLAPNGIMGWIDAWKRRRT